jgi:hypothetical protein
MDERGLVVTFHVSTKTMVEYSSMMGKFSIFFIPLWGFMHHYTVGYILSCGLTSWFHLFLVVLGSVADPGCLSRIPEPTFFHTGSEMSTAWIPDHHQRIYAQNMIRVVHYGSGCWLSPIPDPGVYKEPNHGSGFATPVLGILNCTFLTLPDPDSRRYRSRSASKCHGSSTMPGS